MHSVTIIVVTLIVLILLFLWGLYMSQPKVITCYFDVETSTLSTSVQERDGFTERLDFFNLYSKETLDPDSKIGHYFFHSYNYLDNSVNPSNIYQSGQAIFYLPDGDLMMQVGIERPAKYNPRHIDAGDKFSYQIDGGNGKYMGVTGKVIFDVKSTLREVTLIIVRK